MSPKGQSEVNKRDLVKVVMSDITGMVMLGQVTVSPRRQSEVKSKRTQVINPLSPHGYPPAPPMGGTGHSGPPRSTY